MERVLIHSLGPLYDGLNVFLQPKPAEEAHEILKI